MTEDNKFERLGGAIKIDPLRQTLNAQLARGDTIAAQTTALAIHEQLRKHNPASIANDVREFVNLTEESFHLNTVYRRLNLRERKDTKNVWAACNRLVDEGVLRKVRGKEGVYKRIDTDMEEMEWWDAETRPVDVKFPLEIHEVCNIYPRNIIIIAGESNAGKTGFAFATANLNMDNFNVSMFVSEASANQVHYRLRQNPKIDLEEFREKVRVYDRIDAFEDVIDPDGFNIIDYLEVYDYTEVPNNIREIYRNLKTGIAVINLQKDIGSTWGHGGQKTQQKPALYVALDRDIAKLAKVKSPKNPEFHPQGYLRRFQLKNGSEFIGEGVWGPLDALDEPQTEYQKQLAKFNKK